MRTLLVLIALLIASPALASDADTVKQYKDMIQQQQAMLQQQMDFQMALAQEQTRGMALFGAGNAMINGFNQGFRPMPTPPPITFQPMAMPFPNAGR
jgi:hypothetical protein